MRPEYQLLLSLSQPENINNLSGESKKLLEGPLDWELMVSLAEKHGTAPVVFKNLERVNGAPRSVLDRLKRFYLAVAHKNMKIFSALSDISSAFHDAGVDVIGLKGVHLAFDVYSNIAFRPMQDLDLLVKKTDIYEARRIMAELGFIQPQTKVVEAPRVFDHHLPPYFSRDRTFLVEIHYGIFMGNFVSDGETQKLWGRSMRVSLNEDTLQALSPEDLLVHLAFHLTYHHNFSFGLRGIIDIAQSMTRYREALDWDKIVAFSKKLDICVSLFASLQKVEELLPVSAPPVILRQLKNGCSGHQLKRIKNESARCYLLSPFSSKSSPLGRLFWVRSRLKKIKLLSSIVFPAPDVVRIQFGVKKNLPFILLFYLFRPVQLLRTYLFPRT